MKTIIIIEFFFLIFTLVLIGKDIRRIIRDYESVNNLIWCEDYKNEALKSVSCFK